jgi:hypothetical protein
MQSKRHKEPYNPTLETCKRGTYVAGREVTDTQLATVPMAYVPRVNYSMEKLTNAYNILLVTGVDQLMYETLDHIPVAA